MIENLYLEGYLLGASAPDIPLELVLLIGASRWTNAISAEKKNIPSQPGKNQSEISPFVVIAETELNQS